MMQYVKNEGDSLAQVVVAAPDTNYVDIVNLAAHNITAKADLLLAQQQHTNLVAAMRDFGAQVHVLGQLVNHPNSLFTQDTSFVTNEGYISLRMGLPTRSAEANWMNNFLDSLGVPCVGKLADAETAEGGDLIMGGKVIFVGISTRTNAAGAAKLRQIGESLGYEVRIASVPQPYLHIGGAMSVIAPDTVLAVENVFPNNFFAGFNVIWVPQGDFISGNVITLGNKKLIANAKNIAAIELLTLAGFEVIGLELTEFTKGTGGPSCLILPLQRISAG
jgi:dimethylargininase